MLNKLMVIGSIAGMLAFASTGYSQALPTATGHGAVQVGLGWTFARPDYGPKNIQGVTIFGDFDFTQHIGAEAEYHYVSLITPTDLGENSFLAGPRFVLPHGRFSPYAKGLVGVGDLVIQDVYGTVFGSGAGRHFAYALGGGLDYKATSHIVARGDFEYQHWSYRDGLTPITITIGAAYRFR